MRPIQFEGQTGIYKCPPEVANCDPLPVRKQTLDGRTTMMSVWQLDSAEIEYLINAAKCGDGVAVSLTIFTDVQPVVALSMLTVR